VTTGLWIATGIFALVVAAIAIEAYVKRNRRRALSQSQPKPTMGRRKKVELGQEATDLEMVERANRENQGLDIANKR